MATGLSSLTLANLAERVKSVTIASTSDKTHCETGAGIGPKRYHEKGPKGAAMSRISRIDRSQLAPEIAALYDKAFALRGNVPNMFRVMAHRPEIYATMQAHFAAVLSTGTVSTKLKELIIVRTSQVNETPYCLASHTILARNLGWTDDQLSHLADWPRREDFTPAEKAALRLAETVTRNANAVTDEQFAELRGFYSEGEIVELLCAIGTLQLLQPLQQRAPMEPTRPGEGGASQPEPAAAR